MEGRETRFGIAASAMWAESTTVASNGSVNSMHDSFSPLGGMMPLVNIMLGEIIYGGVGAGMYGMLVFLFITVFIAGLMVGRTPEYMGKKIESREMQLSVLAVVGQTATILFLAAAAVATKTGLSSLNNRVPTASRKSSMRFPPALATTGAHSRARMANTPFYNSGACGGHARRQVRAARARSSPSREAWAQRPPFPPASGHSPRTTPRSWSCWSSRSSSWPG